MLLRCCLLLGLSGLAPAQDTTHALWIMPSAAGLNRLEAEPSGRVRATPARQNDQGCWHLVAAPGNRYYILCLAFGGQRGLELRSGKPFLSAGRGALWKITPDLGGLYLVSCPQGQLGNRLALWSRQRLGRQPEAGNFLRSDLGQYWRALRSDLAGRAQPNGSAPVVRRFARDTVFRVDYGYGGSDEVLWNAADENGNTWIKVKDRKGKALDCYVRANSAWIKPFDLDQL